MHKEYCLYYQALVDREKTWFVVGALRNEDHIAFERALENQTDVLEFFVPHCQETFFLELMHQLYTHGAVHRCEEKVNRYSNQ